HPFGNTKYVEQFAVPFVVNDVVDQRARGIRGIGGMHLASRQPPDEKAVDGARGEFAARCPLARTADLVEEPRYLGSRKIRVEQKAGLFRKFRLKALLLQLLAQGRGAPVLPDDSIVD